MLDIITVQGQTEVVFTEADLIYLVDKYMGHDAMTYFCNLFRNYEDIIGLETEIANLEKENKMLKGDYDRLTSEYVYIDVENKRLTEQHESLQKRFNSLSVDYSKATDILAGFNFNL